MKATLAAALPPRFRSVFLDRLTPGETKAVLTAGKQENISPHQILQQEGDRPVHLWLLVRGRVVVYRLAQDGERIFLRWGTPGDTFGLATILRDAPLPKITLISPPYHTQHIEFAPSGNYFHSSIGESPVQRLTCHFLQGSFEGSTRRGPTRTVARLGSSLAYQKEHIRKQSPRSASDLDSSHLIGGGACASWLPCACVWSHCLRFVVRERSIFRMSPNS